MTYFSSLSFNLWVGTADGSKKHIFLVVVFNVATFVTVDVECFIHILIFIFNKGNHIFLSRLDFQQFRVRGIPLAHF